MENKMMFMSNALKLTYKHL